MMSDGFPYPVDRPGNFSVDPNPTAAQLLPYGYAPGAYEMKCPACWAPAYNVDKRASRCWQCAVNAFRADEAKIQAEQAGSDTCGCGHCTPEITHASDCAVHDAPALPAGECKCGAGYSNLAIICAVRGIAGWLANDGGREKHVRSLYTAARRLGELAAAADSTGELRQLLQQAKWIGQQTTPHEFCARAVFESREQAHEAYRALVEFRDGEIAPGIEAGTATTAGRGAQHESLTRREAPNTPHTHPNPKREDTPGGAA